MLFGETLTEAEKDAVFNSPEMLQNGAAGSIMGGIAGIPKTVDSVLKLPYDINQMKLMSGQKLEELRKYLEYLNKNAKMK